MKNENSDFIEDLEKNVKSIQELLNLYSDIFVSIETFGCEFFKEFGTIYKDQCDTANTFIQETRLKIQNIKLEKIRKEEEQINSQKKEKVERETREKIGQCNTIFDSISERFSKLEIKCKTKVTNLSDSELMREKSEYKVIDLGFNEILDRIVKLSKMNPNEYNETKDFLSTISHRKEKLKDSIEKFKISLENEISTRDLNEEKIKNASILGINLPKFKGYCSAMDFYTFKSEFEKLVAPRVHKRLLSEYLKNNYLEGQAFEVVKEIEDLDKIWERLKLSFGNVVTLLSNKLRDIDCGVPLWQIKNEEKLVQAITKVKNCMVELNNLAEKHSIEAMLFHPSNLSKIFQIVGKKRQTDVMKKLIEYERNDQKTWQEIINYLDKELKVKEQILSYEMHDPKKSGCPKSSGEKGNKVYSIEATEGKKCLLCDKTDHTPTVTSKGKLVINYFACKKFAEMSPKKRFEELKSKKFCFQCLTPGLKANHEGDCFEKFKCPNESHKRFKRGLHVLICDKHKNNRENLELLEIYRSKCITGSNCDYKDFSKTIGISFHVGIQNSDKSFNGTSESEESELAIYMLQTITIGSQKLNIFYDTGCSDMVCTKQTADYLITQERAENIMTGPIILSGVGDKKSVCMHGRYRVSIPLHDGKNINLSGICMDIITGDFPKYPLEEVEKEISKAFLDTGGDLRILPKLPKYVGGNTDLMIGIKYLKYYPKKIFSLPSGLTIYESQLVSHDGSRGIVGGPHKIFSEIQKKLGNNHVRISAYFEELIQTYKNSYKLSLDTSILGIKISEFEDEPKDQHINEVNLVEGVYRKPENSIEMLCSYKKRGPKILRKFENVESVGTEVSYRCVRCRNCSSCLQSSNIECISIQEEVEQAVIDKSVNVELDKNRTRAVLPFLSDPVKKLAPNKNVALKIYWNQVKNLNRKVKDKNDVIKAEKKLHDLGFVDYVENLTIEEKNQIFSSPILYFLPWRAVWNSNSVSTPCRPVYDASHPTSTGLSLNDLLAKGRNNMNKLLEIVIRWTIRRCAYHTDLQNMYNRVTLDPKHWCYQLYHFQENLDPEKEPKIKVIKTLIYGVKSSGNQAERGLRETADLQKDKYPRQNEVISKDIYVDDCLSGEDSYDVARETTDKLEIVLNKGGFRLKGVTFSGFDPPENLSTEGNSINVAGMLWFPKSDMLSLNLGALNFSKKHRGKKVEGLNEIMPENFTRRDCAGRAAEVFDLLGRFTPIIAGIKLDLSELSLKGLGWDDTIPVDLVPQWRENFKIISQIAEIRFRRAIVPPDAVNLDIETIEISDSSLKLSCSAVYARFKRKNGLFSSQLVFARSKIVPKGMSIPRAELYAAVLNASTGHVVKASLGDFIKNRISLTDSQIVLYWINNSKLQLKQWVRNRIIEINRLTDRENWYYIESKNNITDLGTKKGAKLSDVSVDSVWVNGPNWAKGDRNKFPIQSYNNLKLSKDEIKSHDDELLKSVIDNDWINKELSVAYSESYAVLKRGTLDQIGERYQFSGFVIDPNKFRFKKIVRIVALVILFIENLKMRINKSNTYIFENELPSQFKLVNDMYLVTEGLSDFPFKCTKGLVVKLSEQNLKSALNYFYVRASLEVKRFQNKNSYEKISKEQNGILLYTGRILPSQRINDKLELSDVCIDLSMSSFCVPIIDKFSPLAFAIVNEVHWYDKDACHSGNETVMRFVQQIAYIIEGRSLVSQFRRDCPRCLYLRKKTIDVAMGPIPSDNLCIAPAFYVSQTDLFGPYNSYSNINKRATFKIWFAIFCCCVTGAVDIKVCEDYSTSSFVLAFIRFSCKVGYPKKVLPDAGSQLVKGCESMRITFSDVCSKLHEYGVIYEVCPVGAKYMHGKVERKIKHVKESFSKHLYNNRLSIMQWETLGDQIANSINNLPIALGNVTKDLENIDVLTPNRLLLARNNNRCPAGTLDVTEDLLKLVQRNNDIFKVWFRAWLVSYVPSLMFQPKWFRNDRDPKVGDVVLFLKSDKEFDKQYQFGIITNLKASRDCKIRQLEIEYQNHNENVKRHTKRGTREIVVIHPVNELGLIRELNILSTNLPP